MDTFELLDHALAVASATGSAILEGMLRRKPSLLFGHFFYQHGPGVHTIRTLPDCQRAMTEILEGKNIPSDCDIRLFLKAIEDCSTPSDEPMNSPRAESSYEERAQMIGDAIRRRILAIKRP